MRTSVGLFLLIWISCTVAKSTDGLIRTRRQAPSFINVHGIPKTSFSCDDKVIGEYYADPEVQCQAYHICIPGQFGKPAKMTFACPNGTLFSQASRACRMYTEVYCPLAERYYDNLQGSIDTDRDVYSNALLKGLPPPPPTAQPRRTRPVQAVPAILDEYDDYEEVTTPAPRRSRTQSNSRRGSQRQTSSTTTTTTTTTRRPQFQARFTPPPPPPQQQQNYAPQNQFPPQNQLAPQTYQPQQYIPNLPPTIENNRPAVPLRPVSGRGGTAAAGPAQQSFQQSNDDNSSGGQQQDQVSNQQPFGLLPPNNNLPVSNRPLFPRPFQQQNSGEQQPIDQLPEQSTGNQQTTNSLIRPNTRLNQQRNAPLTNTQDSEEKSQQSPSRPLQAQRNIFSRPAAPSNNLPPKPPIPSNAIPSSTSGSTPAPQSNNNQVRLPQRPSRRPVFASPQSTTTTSTTSTPDPNVEYEYYDYEEETTQSPNRNTRGRTRRSAPIQIKEVLSPVRSERELPQTSFTCKDKVAGGVYADIEANCQLFHVCVPAGKGKLLDYGLLCDDGLAFNQEKKTCEPVNAFDCKRSAQMRKKDKTSSYIADKKPWHHKTKRDVPDYEAVPDFPETSFTCNNKTIGGYYADVDTECQIFHICAPGKLPNTAVDMKFMCANGTVFDQKSLVCKKQASLRCEDSVKHYKNEFTRFLERDRAEDTYWRIRQAEADEVDLVKTLTLKHPNKKFPKKAITLDKGLSYL